MSTALLAFLSILAATTLLGALSSRQSRGTPEDYLVASRSVGPWLTALSSVATNNSGFMFVGLIGFTYRGGLHTVWMAAAWILGDLLVWLFVHARVREVSGRIGATSVPELLGRGSYPIVAASAAATLLFLGGYAGAQLKAGAAALHAVLGWPEWAGCSLGALIVAIYCMSGGIRASIWTDAAQSLVMLGSMLTLLGAAVLQVGGPAALLGQLQALDPALVDPWPQGLALGFVPYLLGFVAGGLGAIGQPHILVRSMAIRSVADIARARWLYFAWFVLFYAAAIAVALYARVLLPELMEGAAQVSATERALPALSVRLLPGTLVGVMLAGLFSATLSTADSQILSCSAAVTQDLAPRLRGSVLASKLATLATAAFALWVALVADEGVFSLVLGAWSALGASLGPILLLRLAGAPLPAPLALAMMASGWLSVTLWDRGPLADDVFGLLPGLLVPFALYAVWRARTLSWSMSPAEPVP
jgi:sodium/proline symporter